MIEVKNLTKKYGENTAVSNISFNIEEGKVYGLLGPNGAGKSTTMNIITGCLSATDGSVTVDGADICDDAKKAKRSIGYLPEIPPLYNDLTPLEYLTFVAEAKGLKRSAVQDDVERVMQETQITDVSERIIKNLSKGYRQRVGIAQALIGDPAYIILDEPTVGLDPLQIIEIRKLIRSLSKNRTVILSSHILAEVQEVCDEIIIISHGKIAACGTEKELRNSISDMNKLTVTTKADGAPGREIFSGIEGITDISESESCGEKTFTLTYEKDTDIRENVYLAFCSSEKVLLALTANIPTLEDLFLKLTSDEPEKMQIKEIDDNTDVNDETEDTGEEYTALYCEDNEDKEENEK